MKINPDSSMHITLKERFELKKLGLTYQEIKLAKLPSPWFSQFDSTSGLSCYKPEMTLGVN
jgi:hypothetical protein